MRLTLQAQLALIMTGLLALTLLVLGVITYRNAVTTVNDLSARIARQTSFLIDQRIQSLLDNAESQSELVAQLLERRMDDGDSAPNMFESLAPEMYEMMRVNRELSGISISLSDSGAHLNVQRQTGGRILIEKILPGDDGQKRLQVLRPFGDTLRVSREQNGYGYDPRQQTFYRLAQDSDSRVWTPVYLFESSTGTNETGVTCASPVRDSTGELRAVVTADITLRDLSLFFDELPVGETGYAFVAEVSGYSRNVTSDDLRIIAHGELGEILEATGGDRVLRSLDHEVFTEERTAPTRDLVAEYVLRTRETRLTAGDFVPVRYDSNRERFIGAFMPISAENGPNWVLFITVPLADFMQGVRETGGVVAIAGGLVLLLGLLISLFIARRVARPLQVLAGETERVAEFDLDPRPLKVTRVREVDRLAYGMERMKMGLRSFEKLVPSEYFRYLMESGQEAKLGGERRHLTIYFADIVNFTSLSERMDPEELVGVLSDYLDALSNEVTKESGTIDKYNGDDVMAFWGAPKRVHDHALRACQSACASRARLQELHEEWKAEGKPVLDACFGIATGIVIVGNVGSKERMNYTVIGDTANLASRLQGLNKYYGTHTLLSDGTYSEVRGDVVARLVDWVSVVGREAASPIYELLSMVEDADPDSLALAEAHNQAIALYRERRWREAVEAFGAMLQKWPDDEPARILYERSKLYDDHPPDDDWDGVHHLSAK
jgi:adenylate cyclase